MMRELQAAMGFRFKGVLADSLYGESGCGFMNVLYELKLILPWRFAVTMRSGYHVDRFAATDGASLSACSAMVRQSFLHPRNHLWQAPLSNMGVDD